MSTDKPSAWAVEKSSNMLQGPFNATHAEDDAPLHVAVARALDAAREEGRRAGLEEAARIVHVRGMHLADIDQRLEHERTERTILATKEPA